MEKQRKKTVLAIVAILTGFSALAQGDGFAVLPDFLCREVMDNHKILKI